MSHTFENSEIQNETGPFDDGMWPDWHKNERESLNANPNPLHFKFRQLLNSLYDAQIEGAPALARLVVMAERISDAERQPERVTAQIYIVFNVLASVLDSSAYKLDISYFDRLELAVLNDILLVLKMHGRPKKPCISQIKNGLTRLIYIAEKFKKMQLSPQTAVT
jgi:hypothetical protein